jgi:glycosyltransferase involved in cell wall biosynthesis
MRIAHFIQRYPPALGGSEAYFARLGRHFASKGDDIAVFTTTALDLDSFWNRRAATLRPGVACEDGVTVHRYGLWRCPARRCLLKGLSLLPHRLLQCMTITCNPICPAMWRDCGHAAMRFDVVHAAAFPYGWPLVCALRLARRLGVPFLLTPFLHLGDLDDPRDRIRAAYLSPALRWLLWQADGVFVQTASERDAVLALGLPPHRVQLQGLGVDPAECTGGDRTAARQRWNASPETLVVGHLANNSREKGTIDLLLAVEQLWQRGSALCVVLAGPVMPGFQAFWRQFKRRHPEQSARDVVRLGPLSTQQKRDFYAGIDIFALPSRSDSFGLVLLEAWANGVPNVAYRAGGIADVIRPGYDGLLAPCGDIQGLAARLADLRARPALRRDLGQAGRERLEVDFCWDDKLRLVRDTYAAMTHSATSTIAHR